jgi:hypothetical protein
MNFQWWRQPPALGEDARSHSLVRWEEAKHVDGLIREGTDSVTPALCGSRGYLVPAPRRHSVEHAVRVALHEHMTSKSIEKYTR